MKVKFACFKISKTIIVLSMIILVQIFFIGLNINTLLEEKNFEQINKNINNINSNEIENKVDKNVLQDNLITNKQKHRIMQEEYKGYKVIGKINIPKLELDSYILEETNNKSLKTSVTKLYGPDVNQIGNLCIAGHNYRNNKMFGGIKKLKNSDDIILTDVYGESVTYKVYENYQTYPKDVSCLKQDTNQEREITLITCTVGAIKRVIVKAVEYYD